MQRGVSARRTPGRFDIASQFDTATTLDKRAHHDLI